MERLPRVTVRVTSRVTSGVTSRVIGVRVVGLQGGAPATPVATAVATAVAMAVATRITKSPAMKAAICSSAGLSPAPRACPLLFSLARHIVIARLPAATTLVTTGCLTGTVATDGDATPVATSSPPLSSWGG